MKLLVTDSYPVKARRDRGRRGEEGGSSRKKGTSRWRVEERVPPAGEQYVAMWIS